MMCICPVQNSFHILYFVCQAKMHECKKQMELKKRDILRLQGKEKTLTATFQVSLGENNKFEEFLTRVFKKKIKRTKKKETHGAEGELQVCVLCISPGESHKTCQNVTFHPEN